MVATDPVPDAKFVADNEVFGARIYDPVLMLDDAAVV
jgi:hypothetical protein